MTTVSRRKFLKAGTAGLLGAAGAAVDYDVAQHAKRALALQPPIDHTSLHGGNIMAGRRRSGSAPIGFDPTAMLTDFDYGKVSTLPNGQTLREYDFFAVDKEIEIAPGMFYSTPGPTTGASPARPSAPPKAIASASTSSTASAHPHTIHFHGIHPANMDGVYEAVPAGGTLHLRVRRRAVRPASVSLPRHAAGQAHIAKGLYGAFIIDPKDGRPHGRSRVRHGDERLRHRLRRRERILRRQRHSLPLTTRHPIQIKVGEMVRIYLVNILEFDLINSFHLHANFFHVLSAPAPA